MTKLPKSKVFTNHVTFLVLLEAFVLLGLIMVYSIMELKVTKYLALSENNTNSISNIFSGFNKTSIDGVLIKSSQGSISLEKTASGWFTDGVKVQTSKIDLFFDALEKTKLGDLLSKNPKNYMELGVSDFLGTIVTIRSGSDEISFVVGIPSAINNSFYFRLAGSSDVYLATSNLRSIVNMSREEWVGNK